MLAVAASASIDDAYTGDARRHRHSYGHAKRALYVASVCSARQYGVRTTNLLVANAYGPGDRNDPDKVHALNGMVIRMLAAVRTNAESFEVWGSGRPVREWIYAGDVARLVHHVLTEPVPAVPPVNLAQSRGHSIADSARLIADAAFFRGVLRFNTRYPDGDPQKIMNDALFRTHFPDFVFTDHATGVQRTVQYYRAVAHRSEADGRTRAARVATARARPTTALRACT